MLEWSGGYSRWSQSARQFGTKTSCVKGAQQSITYLITQLWKKTEEMNTISAKQGWLAVAWAHWSSVASKISIGNLPEQDHPVRTPPNDSYLQAALPHRDASSEPWLTQSRETRLSKSPEKAHLEEKKGITSDYCHSALYQTALERTQKLPHNGSSNESKMTRVDSVKMPFTRNRHAQSVPKVGQSKGNVCFNYSDNFRWCAIISLEQSAA